MNDLRVGDRVMYLDRVYLVRGVTPMGATEKRVLIEDPETHERSQVHFEDVRAADDDRD
jgi:hypothetical protein